jgi:hypothetical protein
MNEVLEVPITEAREEITDVAEKVESNAAPEGTELVEQDSPVQNEVISSEVAELITPVQDEVIATEVVDQVTPVDEEMARDEESVAVNA